MPEAVAAAEPPQRARLAGGSSITLRWRLSLAIGVLLTAALAASALVAVANARVAVANEVGASLHTASASLDLTLKLLPAHDPEAARAAVQLWVASYSGARHLCVTLDVWRDDAAHCPRRAANGGVPAWFARGADFDPEPVVRELDLGDQPLRVRLVADPGDELREAWVQVRGLLLLMGVLAFAVNLFVFLTIRAGLRPLSDLMRAMDQIGRGQPATALPRSGPPEVTVLSEGLAELEARIARGRDEVRALHLRNLDLQEDERRMVARELHDEIGQHVAAIEMETIRLSRLAPAELEQRRLRLQQLRASVAEIHRVSRRLVNRLRPPSIQTLGLVGALEALFERWRDDHPEPRLSAEIDPACDEVPHDRAVHLYRLVQESLSNAVRHAQARVIVVRVAVEHEAVVVAVVDDGCGFDTTRETRGYGLAGMRERVEALAGRFEVMSRPGAGTRVEARLPRR